MDDSSGKLIGHRREFIDHGDGTVTDTRTGLMWMRCSLGQAWNGSTCVGFPDYIRMNDRSRVPSKYAGHDDWRLPSLEELKGLVLPSHSSPAIDTTVFPNTGKNVYWTSTTDGARVDDLWQIDFTKGKTYCQEIMASAYIRLVRDAPASSLTVSKSVTGITAFPLKVIAAGLGKGMIVRVPSAESYRQGQVVSLTAVASEDSTFVGWKGDASGKSLLCNIGMDSPKTIVAEFALRDYFSLGAKNNDPGLDTARLAVSGSKHAPIESNAKVSVVVPWGNNLNVTDPQTKPTLNSEKSSAVKLVQVETRISNADLPRQLQADAADLRDSVLSGNTSGARIGLAGDFIDHGDGTVTDTRSGLMWMRPAIGQTWRDNTCSGDAQPLSMIEAKSLTIEFASLDGWRLPTIDELRDLTYPDRLPALDEQAFPNQSGRYFWSATFGTLKEGIDGPSYLQIFALRSRNLGVALNPEQLEHVRLVRTVKSFRAESGEMSATKPESEPAGSALVSNAPPDRVKNHTTVTAVTASGKQIGYFLDHGDGTVTDSRTGLMWMRASVGQEWDGQRCRGVARRLVLGEAIAIRSYFAGYNNWRLPTVEELKGLILHPRKSPTIDVDVFPDTPENYFWTSSPDIADQRYVWRVGFDVGNINGNLPDVLSCVRLVRDGLRFSIEAKTLDSSSGVVLRTPDTSDYPFGSLVTLTAQASVGFKFKCWHGDASGVDPVYKLTMNASKAVTAEFELIQFGLSLNTQGLGSISRSLEALRYVQDSTITLTAIPATGTHFKQWSGDASGSNPACSITFDSDKAVTAEFVRLFPLVVNTSGTGFGSVTRDPPEETLAEGSAIKLVATPDENSKFVRWYGDASYVSESCMLVMNSPKAVYAEFSLLESFTLTVTQAGSGSGTILRSLETPLYKQNRSIKLTAKPAEDSRFVGWLGDATGTNPQIKVTFDSDKTISAEFSKLASFSVTVSPEGTGSGSVMRSPDSDFYLQDSAVMLTAVANQGSFFDGWGKDGKGKDVVCPITVDSNKQITAAFTKLNLPVLGLDVVFDSSEFQEGDESFVFYFSIVNKGDVGVEVELLLTNYVSIEGQREFQDYWVDGLADGAAATRIEPGTSCKTGILFSKHRLQKVSSGDLLHVSLRQRDPLVCLRFIYRCINQDLLILALIAVEAVDVRLTGSGSGTITLNDELLEDQKVDAIDMMAHPAEGSIFNGWKCDNTELGCASSCKIPIASVKYVTAEFMKLDIPKLGIDMRFEAVEDANMKSGDNAQIVYLSIANEGQKQAQVELPLATYVTKNGEEIEQSAWLSGLLSGAKSSTIRSGAFRKMGLVFFKSRLPMMDTGDHVYLTVMQAKPARRLSFTFRCIDKKSRAFTLIKATSEDPQTLDEDGEVSPEKVDLLQRVARLEESLQEVLRRLDLHHASPALLTRGPEPSSAQTLPEVLAWLCTQASVPLAALRLKLLPLDLMPSAIIDDINERAYDLAGEVALEETGDAVAVRREVLFKVLAAWDW